MQSALKILHTADWHLGHQLHGYSRYHEHQVFLDWLSEQIETYDVDILCVSGDLFDTANPSATSWQQLYQFLAYITHRCPGLQVIMVAGNHDSPSKISAPGELLAHFDLHLVGQVHKSENGQPELNRLLIPMKNRQGELQGWALAVPFLRASDLVLDSQIGDGQQRWQQAITTLYQQLGELAESVRQPGQMLMAIGHGHIRGGQVSELSERQILMGGEHALPANIFPASCDYVALGHLHLGQKISAPIPIHYSGSPLPLSLSERRYHHHVQLVTWQHQQVSIHPLNVPRHCQMLQIPSEPKPLPEVLTELAQLPVYQGALDGAPYLEVQVRLETPVAHLREQVMQAISDKGMRLTRIRSVYPDSNSQGYSHYNGRDLDELTPVQVFELCYQKQYQQMPGDELMQAFAQVVREVEEQQ
ncbi:exonuclease SbcCD subunit D C-terminal domain-containing protein [Celerinatantimonas yamalensis]|uniref:Nuclease SbcCD subunit D n=1 Tax=Celerinatantimonas yamalensis TaxID=559956 RepID=A0ABW9G729_9GAMM